jgi:hypothetical protein
MVSVTLVVGPVRGPDCSRYKVNHKTDQCS